MPSFSKTSESSLRPSSAASIALCPGSIAFSTSNRTMGANRRSLNSVSIMAKRSSAVSSSNSVFAFRVTLNRSQLSTSISGNRRSRFAIMTCSRGTATRRSSSQRKRGIPFPTGTFTRATNGGRSAVCVMRTSRLRERLEMNGKGWAGSVPWGVTRG